MALPAFVPRLLRIPARFVPAGIPASLLALAANRLLNSQHLMDRLEEIEGKRLCLYITDIDLELNLEIRAGRLTGITGQNESDTPWDMRISGEMQQFLLLAARQEDPDTLFFNRSLVLEGKTEVGLTVKNMIDALDLGVDEQFQAAVGRKPPDWLSGILKKVAARVRTLLQ